MLGQTISHYHVLEKLGEGGMGVVYKVRDTHLDRVAVLKLLPAGKAADPERKRRFVHEAKSASALNHPNIVTVYDIDSDNGIDFIAMEYVPGKTLDQLIPRQGLQLNEALRYAVQVAEALAAAHHAGIIHRDVKPNNIIVAETGLVKVLDFGLAKLLERDTKHDLDPLATVTLHSHETPDEEGLVLGTVPYMSPEQVEGKKLDERSDIFAFGSLLYEMVTGQRAFQGASNISTLASVLHEEPRPMTVESVPPELERAIARCLRKDPSRRWQHMADVKVALEDIRQETDSGITRPAARRKPAKWLPGARAALVLVLLALATATVWLLRSWWPEKGPAPLAVPLTSFSGVETAPSFSPDCSQVAFVWNGETQDNYDIYVKLVGAGTPLRLTTDRDPDINPAWSPDGRLIAFHRLLRRERAAVQVIPALGGPERRLTEVSLPSSSAFGPFLSWSPDSKWLIGSDRDPTRQDLSSSLFLISVETGEKRKLTDPPKGWVGDSNPGLSPDGRTLAFIRAIGFDVADLYLLAISKRLEPDGAPRPLTHENGRISGLAWEPDGRALVYAEGGGGVLWRVPVGFPRKPERLALAGEGAETPAMARGLGDGRRLAFSRRIFDTNIWRVRVASAGARPAAPENLISSTRLEWDPQFSPDGKRIAFASNRSGASEVWVCEADGSRPSQLTSTGATGLGSPRWSPDGEHIVFDSGIAGQWDIYMISAAGGKPEPLTSGPSNEHVPSWSRDGKWVYFASNRTGEFQVWKVAAQGDGSTREAVQVTRHGGYAAFESADGGTLYYSKQGTGEESSIWRVAVSGGEETRVLEPVYIRNFALAERGLYFIPPRVEGSRYEIRFFNFATRTILPVAALPQTPYSTLAASPDGQSILYSAIDHQGSDLMLIDNFP